MSDRDDERDDRPRRSPSSGSDRDDRGTGSAGRPPRDSGARDDRGSGRSWSPSGDRRNSSGPRQGGRGDGDRPREGDRGARGDRPSYGDRPQRSDRASSSGGAPRGGRPTQGGRPPQGDRPQRDDRPSYGDRPQRSDRPGSGGRPQRGERPSYGDRPSGGRPTGGRPQEGDRRGGAPARGGYSAAGRGGGRGAFGSRDRETPEDRDPFGLKSVRPAQEVAHVPDDVEPRDLDKVARGELKTLSKENADWVAKHLVMAGRLIEEDPEEAHKHALSAGRRAGRIGVVRETIAITAYTVGDYAMALRELRTYRRISGREDHLPLMVDSERGLERPERALELGRSVDVATLDVPVRVQLAIAMSGARLDLGQPEAALRELEIPQLDKTKAFSYSPALFDAYATVLDDLGRESEGDEWRALSERAGAALDAIDGEDDRETVEIVEEELELGDDEFVDLGGDDEHVESVGPDESDEAVEHGEHVESDVSEEPAEATGQSDQPEQPEHDDRG